MSERSGRPWLNYALGVLCLGAIVAAVLVVGPASGSGGSGAKRTATAAAGVVQSTVSGSGNLEPASQLNLGFKASGTVEHVYVKQGEHVTEGQLLATLDPVPAEVTLEQSRATLQSAEASLAREEETDGEGSQAAESSSPSAGNGGGRSGSTEHASTGAQSGSTLSQATREANIASARAAVKSDALTVRGDEEAVAGTKLYAPEDGTIVSLSGQVGEVVSATGTTKASSSSSGSSAANGGSGAGGGGGGSGGSGSGGSTGASGSGSSGDSSSFAVLSDLSSMKLVAALSESEIHQVKAGQIATVTIEALEGRKLAAHVGEVAMLASSSSSGVVSYDVTFQLDQMDPGLKPGMSVTAEVVVKQEAGISVPSSAVSGGSVTVLRGGKEVDQAVSTGLVGNSSTVVLSGLKAGETVVLPQASSGSSSLSSLLRSRLGGGGLGGGALGGGGGGPFIGGGRAVFRGGG